MTTTNKELSFPEAIAYTESLMEKIIDRKLEEKEIETEISSLVKSKNGARGFFVVYLTSDLPLADNPSSGVIKGLQSAPSMVSELMVKNLAMSAATALNHRRNNDQKAAEGSDRVNRRSSNLIQQLDLEDIKKGIKELEGTLKRENNIYQNFLERWKYDSEQKKAIQEVLIFLDS